VTSGTVEALHITFPLLSAFHTVALSGALVDSDWRVSAPNNMSDDVTLTFTTTPTPGSLVGFEGGTITGSSVFIPIHRVTLYSNLSGRITPVPERSSLALLGTGLLCCLGFALVRRRNKAALI